MKTDDIALSAGRLVTRRAQTVRSLARISSSTKAMLASAWPVMTDDIIRPGQLHNLLLLSALPTWPAAECGAAPAPESGSHHCSSARPISHGLALYVSSFRVRTNSTGTVAPRTTRSATLPINQRLRPDCPRVDITIRSTWLVSANCGIST
jgi:hypothetical protein